jgi:hypothetical protein
MAESRTTTNTIMTESSPTTNTYIVHTSLETISTKIKKLQSDLSSAATGKCWGPGKQKVLERKHNVDALAMMVKGLDVDGIAYVFLVFSVFAAMSTVWLTSAKNSTCSWSLTPSSCVTSRRLWLMR